MVKEFVRSTHFTVDNLGVAWFSPQGMRRLQAFSIKSDSLFTDTA